MIETCYIGVVGPEIDFQECWKSILTIERRPGDSPPVFFRGTKGYELRQAHVNNFIQSDHDFLLMLDHDMVFAVDTLERLRSHRVSFVSGFYMRRQYTPVAPIWFEDNPAGEWPFKPYTHIPEEGRLHRIGASGWGCILLHRSVIEDTKKVLKGQHEIIEDAMTVWPFDWREVLAGREQIRPLRGTYDPVGSDIRFPFYARAAGHQLWGDPDVRPGHMLNYPIGYPDWTGAGDEYRRDITEQNDKRVAEAREQWREVVNG